MRFKFIYRSGKYAQCVSIDWHNAPFPMLWMILDDIKYGNQSRQFEKYLHGIVSNMFHLNTLKQTSEKNVALQGAQTLTSHNLGECPNHLNY